MGLVVDALRALWRRVAYESVDPDGPAGTFAKAMAASVTGEGVEAVVDVADAQELLRRALDPQRAPGELRYPGWARIEAAGKAQGFLVGLGMLREAVLANGLEDGDEVTPALMLGTVIPRPGPGRRPLIEEVVVEEGDPEAGPAFARVDYAYEGDEASHSLSVYRAPDGPWQVDLVWELAKGGALQEALGRVQVPGCMNEAFEV